MTRPHSDVQLKAISDGLDAGKKLDEIVVPPYEKKKTMNNEESRAQKHVVRWWDLMGCRTHNLSHTLLHSVPNGGFRSVITASIMKAEGQRRGVMDLKLNVARNGYHGMWLEMKAANGVLSAEQIEFKRAVSQQGYHVEVCHSAVEAISAIEKYLRS